MIIYSYWTQRWDPTGIPTPVGSVRSFGLVAYQPLMLI